MTVAVMGGNPGLTRPRGSAGYSSFAATPMTVLVGESAPSGRRNLRSACDVPPSGAHAELRSPTPMEVPKKVVRLR